MGGGGGGGGWSSPTDLAKAVRQTEDNVASTNFQTQLAEQLSAALKQFNDRDTSLVRSRLDKIMQDLDGNLDGAVDQVFGGSVAKHTYVDGLSDIDCLLMVNRSELEGESPKAIIDFVEQALKKKLAGQAEVSVGQLAVTIKYNDGMEIQILPALKEGDTYKIPSSHGADSWSSIDPRKFQTALTKYNQQCNGNLISTIKLAKAVMGELPDARQLSGYHIESLAIDAFKNYKGAKTAVSMLPHFFNHAKARILQPMTDSTGQSVHVDGDLGAANSDARRAAGHLLGRIAKRMDNASASGSLSQWSALFGEE